MFCACWGCHAGDPRGVTAVPAQFELCICFNLANLFLLWRQETLWKFGLNCVTEADSKKKKKHRAGCAWWGRRETCIKKVQPPKSNVKTGPNFGRIMGWKINWRDFTRSDACLLKEKWNVLAHSGLKGATKKREKKTANAACACDVGQVAPA